MFGVVTAGDAAIVVAAITAAASIYVAGRNRKDIKQINRAVNHVGPNEPTLIDRVRTLETRGERMDKHSRWVHVSLDLFATQLGVALPDHPDEFEIHPASGANG